MKKISFVLLVTLVSLVQAQDSVVVYFAFDSYYLNPTEKLKLQNIQLDQIESIDGYTDTCGPDSYNIWLAKQRISTVSKVLLLGKNSQIQQTPFGENFKTAPSNKENRKVVVKLISPEGKTNSDKEEKTITKQMEQAKTGDEIKLNSLNFQPGLDILLPEALPTLAELLEVMKKNEKLMIEIQGHICCASFDIDDLSTARAKRVFDYLETNGISAERMDYIGFGVSQPLFPIPEKSNEEQIANRRVVVKIISN